MSKKQWLVLLMLFLVYLLLGASIFHHIESRLEVEKVRAARRERIEINDLLNKHYLSTGSHDQFEILDKLTKYCGKSVHNYSDTDVDQLKWDFYNSFYFAYTVVSTIGYGNLAPTNMLGRVLMIFYALIGIPINGILLSQLGEFFSETFVSAVRRYKAYKQNHNEYSKNSLSSLEKRRFGLAMKILMYLIPGFIMFIFFPAFLFSYYEQWDYDEAVYYAFVTLTTIGFGDYVAGQDNTKGSGVFFIMYKIFLIVWISFGLGYIVMIMTFIGRGMTSKKIARIEHKLALKLKHTQSKIWNEFNEDVSYLRRVFNELQFSKVKRVYVDEYDYDAPPLKFSRSNSFPNLRDLVYGGLEPQLPPHPRRRANSEVVPSEEAHVARVVSETDLQRIDKNATFATHAMVQPAELLARLVNILGYIPPPPDDDEIVGPQESGIVSGVGGGVQGFSEKEILASEGPAWNSDKDPPKWKLGGADLTIPPRPYRSRAHSEVRIDRSELPVLQPEDCEWTWSGPAASTKIQEIMRARKSTPSDAREAASKTRFLSRAGLGLPKSVLPRWMKQLNSGKRSTERSVSVSENEGNYNVVNSEPDPFPSANRSDQYQHQQHQQWRRNSYAGPHHHFTHTGASSLLEETSVADFIRALTALHSRVGAVPDDLALAQKASGKLSSQPQRKLGTASLTPPKLPSLFTLFSPPQPSGHSQSQQNTVTGPSGLLQVPGAAGRRYSLRTAENSSASTPVYQRRATQAAAHAAAAAAAKAKLRPRRYSERPAMSSSTSPPFYTFGSSTTTGQVDERPSPPPYSTEPFVLDNPKKPLVKMEGAPGVSSPVATSIATYSPSGRRFSLRPAQIDVPPAPSSSSATPAPSFSSSSSGNQQQQQQQQAVKPIPRWKAGMLQRQIVQQNVQRKVQRAMSLSDVHSDDRERRIGISPLALHDNARTITSVQGQRLTSAGKTVTIVSPELSRTRAEYQQPQQPQQQQLQQLQPPDFVSSFPVGSSRFRRYHSDIESVSSKSSSQSSKSLDRDGVSPKTSEASSMSGSSRKSSFNDPGGASKSAWDDEWDFSSITPAATDTNDNNNETVLSDLVKQSDATTRQLSGDDKEEEEMPSAAAQSSSFVSIEPWSSPSRHRASSSVAAPDRRSVERALMDVRVERPKSDDVRIDVPDDDDDDNYDDNYRDDDDDDDNAEVHSEKKERRRRTGCSSTPK